MTRGPILDFPVAELGLSVRTTASLRLAGLHQLSAVLARSSAELAVLPHLSPACVAELDGLAAELRAWLLAGRPIPSQRSS